MSQRFIYLLKLEQGNFFLISREPNEDPLFFFLKITLQYGFLKKFAPLQILEKWPETHSLDLDYHVKKQMLIHGIEKVRGGSYLSVELSTEQTALLQRELGFVVNNIDETCPEYVIKEIITQYQNIPFDQIGVMKKQIEENYNKYLEESRILEKNKLDFQESRSQLDWLFKKSREQVEIQKNTLIYDIIHKQEVVIYRQNIAQLHIIYNIFMTLYKRPFLEESYSDLPIHNPEFLLDDFMYHGHRTHLAISIDRLERLYNCYSFFLTYIENRFTEMEFDVASWGVTAKWRFPRELHFISMLTKTGYQKR